MGPDTVPVVTSYCPEPEVRDIRFRSVVHSDILSERPATLAIILMARPMGMGGTSKPVPERTLTGSTVRVDNEAEPRRLE